MITVEFSTQDNKYPIFRLPNYNISCFLDTGSNIPVWNDSLKLFMETFKNCKPINTNIVASIGGFGNGTVDMAIYKINNFVITNNKQSITYKELYIAIEDNRTRNFDLLLTYSMFKNINIVIRPTLKNRKIAFVIEDENKRFNSNYKLDKNGKLYYTESYLQEIELTEQYIMAYEVYNLIKNNK